MAPHTQGRFKEALDAYATELRLQPMKFKDKKLNERIEKVHGEKMLRFHAQRGRIFFMIDSLDSARAEITTAIDGMKASMIRRNWLFFTSRRRCSSALGMIEERDIVRSRREPRTALRSGGSRILRRAYSPRTTPLRRATRERARRDGSRGPARAWRTFASLQICGCARARTTRRGRGCAARKAIAADPWYGAPRLLLARIADVEQYTDEAIDEYRKYLAIASRTDYQYLVTKDRLSKLTSTVATTGPVKP